MASSEVHLVERYNDLLTQQRRLRHLRSIYGRNIKLPEGVNISQLKLHFSLHYCENSPAFYTSEKILGSLNPSWRSFNMLHVADDAMTAATSRFIVRVWQTVQQAEKLIIEWKVDMFGFLYIGQKVQRDSGSYGRNTLIFSLVDGVYGAPDTQLTPGSCDVTRCLLKVDQACLRDGYSVSSLSRIQTVLRASLQTHASVKKVHDLIEDKLKHNVSLTKKQQEMEMLRLRQGQLRREVESRTTLLQSERETLETKQANSHRRDVSLKTKFETLEKDKNRLHDKKSSYFDVREDLIKNGAQLVMRRKQLIYELASIYPIEELPDNKGFTICGIKLPNSEDFSGTDEQSIDVSLGFTCHLFTMVSQFLDVPVRYHMEFLSSRSKIRNPVIEDKYKEFPLYGKGQEKVLFNYGVYLLNKNIAQLRYYCGLGTTDLRLTLPNLKTLMELRLGVSLGNGSSMLNTSLPGQHIPVPPNLGGPQKLTSGIRREPYSANSLEKLVENAEAAAKFEQILSETKASYNHKLPEQSRLTVLKLPDEQGKPSKDKHKRTSSLGAMPLLSTQSASPLRGSSPDEMFKGSPDSFFATRRSLSRSSRDSSLERMLDRVVPCDSEMRDSETGEGERVLKTVPVSGQPILVALQNCDQDASSETEVNLTYGSRFMELSTEKALEDSIDPEQQALIPDCTVHETENTPDKDFSTDSQTVNSGQNANAANLLTDLSQANTCSNHSVGNPPTADHMMGLLDHALEAFEDNSDEDTEQDRSTSSDLSSRDIEQRAAALNTLSSFKLAAKKSDFSLNHNGADASEC